MEVRVGRKSSTRDQDVSRIQLVFRVYRFPAALPEGPHPIPSRTRKLSPPGPMVLLGRLSGRVGRCRNFSSEPRGRATTGLFFLRNFDGDGGLLGGEAPRSTACSVRVLNEPSWVR